MAEISARADIRLLGELQERNRYVVINFEQAVCRAVNRDKVNIFRVDNMKLSSHIVCINVIEEHEVLVGICVDGADDILLIVNLAGCGQLDNRTSSKRFSRCREEAFALLRVP